jgi:hypothetical protein
MPLWHQEMYALQYRSAIIAQKVNCLGVDRSFLPRLKMKNGSINKRRGNAVQKQYFPLNQLLNYMYLESSAKTSFLNPA